MKVEKRTSTYDGPSLPAMQPLAVKVVDVEYITSDRFKDKVKDPETEEIKEVPQKQVRVTMEVQEPEEYKEADAKVWGTHTMTLGQRKDGTGALLRQLVQAVHPQNLDDEELHDFDLDDLKGKTLTVIGNYREDDEVRQYLRPIAYTRLTTKRTAAPKAKPATTPPPPEAAAESSAAAPPPPPGATAPPPPPPAAKPKPEQVSPDGVWGWNGTEWRPIAEFDTGTNGASEAAAPPAADAKKVSF